MSDYVSQPHPLAEQLQAPEVRALAAAAAAVPGQPGNLLELVSGRALPYALLCERHDEHDGEYWADLRALYAGGKFLLKNPQVMARIFPQHSGEKAVVYAERVRRAFYIAHLSTIIDKVVAGLASDPLRMAPPGSEDDQAAELSEFWQEFMRDCSPPGGARVQFGELMLDQIRTGLLLGRFATLVDLPRLGAAYKNLAEQREAGALDPYVAAIPPECLLDWEQDDSGELVWVNYCKTSCPRPSVFRLRSMVREEYRIYTFNDWALYVVEYSRDQEAVGAKKKPRPDDVIAPAAVGAHTFGRVPIIYDVVPPGLWAGNKIYSMAVEYLNKSCGLSWAEYRSVYAQLYEFCAGQLSGIDGVPNEHQADPDRARRTPRGPGNVQVRGSEDDAKYVGPDTAGFAHVAAQLGNLRQDMYRVTYEMALAEDNSGALVRRSAESKNVDHEVTDIVLSALGSKVLRPHAERVIDAGAVVRGDEPGYIARGAEDFAEADVTTVVEQATSLEVVTIPSATFQKLWKKRVAKTALGDEATPEVMAKVEQELDAAITQDQFDLAGDADLLDEEARAAEAAARGEEAGRVERGELPVSQKKPPKPAGGAKKRK